MERGSYTFFRDLVIVIDSGDFKPMLNDKELEILRAVKTAPSSLRLSEIGQYCKGH